MNRLTSRLFVPGFLLLTALVAGVFAPAAMAQAQTQGTWQTLPTTMPINPVHAALLRTGKVLIVSGSGNVAGNTDFESAIWDPQTAIVTTQPVTWDTFCNGMIVLPDGRPFIIGGTLQYDPFHGEFKSAVYDAATNSFTILQSMAHGRWYPSATVLGDGRVMTFSGLDENSNTNTTVEIYTVGSGWSAAFAAPWTPPLYPRMHLLPNGNVFYSGSTTTSALFNPTTHAWTQNVANTVSSVTRTYGSSVLLPLTPANGYKPRVLILGGGSPATNTTETIDLSATTPIWVNGPTMNQGRIEMNATMLPNGKVLAIGGSINDEDTATASLKADLYDSASNTISPAGTEAFARLYHSVSLLLPDGTVWVAGGNPQRGTYEPHMEIYTPPYLFKSDGTPAVRPTVTGLSSGRIGYGTAFQIQTPDAANISSVVLMRNGAVTHAFDMDQRYVGLSFTAGSNVLNVTGPPNGNIAPPGYYMLFILNSSGVPSVADMVQVSTAASDIPPDGTITSPGSDQTIFAGQAVSYAGTGTDADGTISAYSWSFPGGSPTSSALANPGNVIYNTPGTYTTTFTVTDNALITDPTPPTRTITVQPDFGITASPALNTVSPGSATSYTATITFSIGFSGTVTFSASGLPAGAAATFNPTSRTTVGSSTMTITTTGSTPVGTFPVTITGTSGTLSHSTNVTLNIAAGGSAPINFVQVNSAVPQTAQTSVPVTYSVAQAVGDLNVVVVGWNDATATVNTVTDSKGNTYALAAGPLVQSGTATQAIYYAKNIFAAAAGANIVTVKFNGSAKFADVRILEYSGIDLLNPFDVSVGAQGNGATASSGAVTTTNANDLLVAADVVQTGTPNSGAGFTSRIITNPDADIVEDTVVSALGSYTATAPVSAPAGWLIQMVAFKAAGSAVTPTAPSNLTATAAGPTQINLTWTAATETGGTISQYLIERCSGASCNNFAQIATSATTSFSNTGLTGSTSYSYRVRASDAGSVTGPYSNTASATTSAPTFVAPASLTATASSPVQVNLSWTAATETGGTITQYLIERCTGSACSTFAQVATSTITTFSDTGLLGSTSYSYRVRATDGTNFSTYSNTGSVVTPAPILSAPLTVVASTSGSTQINLNWIAATETGGTISQYLIESCQGAGCSNFAQIGTSAAISFSNTGLSPSTSYSYRVRATDAGGDLGPYSNTASATTPATSPTAPSSLTATAAGPTQINLAWVAATEAGGTISQYLIERCQGAGCSTFAQIGTSATTGFSDTPLTASTSYSYRVRAMDTGSLTGPYSNTASATTTAPSFVAPSSLLATAASPVQINLSWAAATETGGTITQYLIERCTGAACSTFAQVGTSTTTTFNNAGLLGSTSYSYRVRATDGTNSSAYSNTSSATTPPPTFTAPSNLTATAAGNTQINLAWTAATETGGAISQYLIERCQGAGCTTFVQIATSTTTTFNNTGLLAGTTYTYQVRATDAASNLGPYSNTAAATTTTAPPPAIAFVQTNSASPQTPQTTVGITYNGAQAAGDLNVVIVGWNDTTRTVSSVADSKGNVYAIAGPVTVYAAGGLSQAIYYAKNIAVATAGANTVTVTFSGAAVFADIRILEYTGIDQVNPLDGYGTATGNSTTATSAAFTTTNPNDLIVGANLTSTGTSGPGSGFTNRGITNPDSDISEDRVVTVTGSYTTTCPIIGTGQWIMQGVAFKAHP